MIGAIHKLQEYMGLEQDLEKWLVILFGCTILIAISVIFDLQSGIDASRKQHQKIKSRILRRTVLKFIDYLRLVMFGGLIDFLGVLFPWYRLPFIVILVTLAILLIEAKSMLENYQRGKSAALEVPEMIKKIIDCSDNEAAQKLLKEIKNYGGKK